MLEQSNPWNKQKFDTSIFFSQYVNRTNVYPVLYSGGADLYIIKPFEIAEINAVKLKKRFLLLYFFLFQSQDLSTAIPQAHFSYENRSPVYFIVFAALLNADLVFNANNLGKITFFFLFDMMELRQNKTVRHDDFKPCQSRGNIYKFIF